MASLEISWREQIQINTAIAHHTNEELALGFLRYEDVQNFLHTQPSYRC